MQGQNQWSYFVILDLNLYLDFHGSFYYMNRYNTHAKNSKVSVRFLLRTFNSGGFLIFILWTDPDGILLE